MFEQLVQIGAFGLLAAAVWTDLRSRTIPDTVSIVLIALAVLATSLGWHGVTFTQLGIGLAVGFALAAALFHAGGMGGGDVKLCAGLGALSGWPGIFEVLFATALSGGVVALWARHRGDESLPYAPAIAAGYVTTVILSWTFGVSGLCHLMTGRTI